MLVASAAVGPGQDICTGCTSQRAAMICCTFPHCCKLQTRMAMPMASERVIKQSQRNGNTMGVRHAAGVLTATMLHATRVMSSLDSSPQRPVELQLHAWQGAVAGCNCHVRKALQGNIRAQSSAESNRRTAPHRLQLITVARK